MRLELAPPNDVLARQFADCPGADATSAFHRFTACLANTMRPVRSFRLYLRQAIVKPAREVADYSGEERDRLRDAFRSVASDYRRHTRVSYVAAGGFAGCLIAALILPKVLFPWFLIPAFTFWLVALGSMASAPCLICPGCSNEIDCSFGRYCPECGSPELQTVGWLRSPRCTACGKSMRRGKGRHYRIRACTHCGLMLDDSGL